MILIPSGKVECKVNCILRYILVPVLCITGILQAEIDYSSIGSENTGIRNESQSGPFSVLLDYDWIGKSKFKNGREKGRKIGYSQALADVGFVFYYDPECKEGASFDLSYTAVRLDWEDNLRFDKKNFNNVGFSLGFASERLCGWLWKMQATLNIDADYFDFNEYSTWDLLFWGRYTYEEDIHIHLGFLALTGMKIDRIYPILGFDWQISDDWILNAVFPMNISLQYLVSCDFSIDLAARFFDSRYRLGNHEPYPKSLWEYINSGVELGLNYNWAPYLKLNLHAGTTFGGTLRTANRHYHHIHRHRFKPAPYAGGELSAHF